MHLPTCLVCDEKTDSGTKVAEKMRPLCGTHHASWNVSGEGIRWLRQPLPRGESEHSTYARAFMDWLTRVRAELRNGGKVAA